MLYELETKDLKLTPLAQTGFNNFFNNTYTNKYNNILSSLWNKENIRGFSKDYFKHFYFYLAYMLGLIVYIEYSRGVNTSYAYFDNKYDFETIRAKLNCYDISLNHVLSAFGLFDGTVIAPGDVVDGISYPPPGEGGTLISHTMVLVNLAKGKNLLNHNRQGYVRVLTVKLSTGYSQDVGWSIDDALITDNTRQVVIYTANAYNGCTVELIIDTDI